MRELFARLAARPFIALELIAASLMVNLLALASPLFVIQVLNRYVAHGVDTTLATLTAGVVGAVVLELGFRQVRLRLADGVNARADAKLAGGAFAVLTSAKASQMDMMAAGTKREVLQGVEAIQAAYAAPNIASVLDVPFAAIFLGALYLLSPTLCLLVTGFVAAVFATSVIGFAATRGLTRDAIAVSGRRQGLVGIAISASDAVRAFNGAAFLRGLWADETSVFNTLRHRLARRQGWIQALTQSAQALMGVAVIAVGATLVVRGELDVGALIGTNILASRALGPFVKLAQLSAAFTKARQSLDMLREFARLPRERTEGAAIREYKGTLEFRDLSFAHPGSTVVLFEKLNHVLEPGTVTVVAGGNGSGKTTMARLIAGLIDPSRGQIFADGVELTQLVPEWWRKQLVYMPQEPWFLSATIRDNLLAFNENLDDAALNRLIDTVGLRQFIDQSPGGLTMALANGGANLSLGIRRRLALARALATGGTLGIFDEPTEGLDADGCARVYAVMNDMARRGCTIIACSHDPNIVKGAQWVIDLDSKPTPKLLQPQLDGQGAKLSVAAAGKGPGTA